MPRIFDNIDQQLLPALRDTLQVSKRAGFCVGYFNLRGWRQIDSLIEQWPGGEGYCCHILIGMQRLPHEELRLALSLAKDLQGIDQQAALRMKKKIAEEFRDQLITDRIISAVDPPGETPVCVQRTGRHRQAAQGPKQRS